MIREAELKDLKSVTDMAFNFSQSLKLPFEPSEYDLMMTAKTLIEDDKSVVLIAEKGVVAGTIEPLFINRQHWILQERGWWVEPEARKQGLGDQLRKALEDWGFENGASIISMITVGGGGDENLKATFDAAELNSVNLFNVSQYEMGAAVPSNPSITSVAERVAHMPGVKLGSDYLFHAKNLLEQSALQFEFPKEVYQVTLGGRVFHVMELQMIFPGVAVNQKYFACVEKRYALSFITTFNTPEEGEMLDAILDTLVFSE